MGRCGQQKVPHHDNDFNDADEALANGEENLLNGLDLIEQIVALLPEGFDVMINFEEVDDQNEAGIFMSLPHEEYPEEDIYPADSDTWRQFQLKSGVQAIVNEEYDEDYDWLYEGGQEDYDDYSADDALMPFTLSDQLFHRLSTLPVSSELVQYYDDYPLDQEEIALEVLELEHLVNSEILTSSVDTNLGMPEEDFNEYCSGFEE